MVTGRWRESDAPRVCEIRDRLRSNNTTFPGACPNSQSPSQRKRKMQERNSPSNLLDNLTDEGGPLAEVALHPRDPRLGDTRGSLL